MRTLHLIANTRSGRGIGAQLPDIGKKICAEHGATLINYPVESAADFETQTAKAIAAAQKDDGVVVAAGGDGTLRGVAQQVAGTEVKFAAVATGTFNYFARGQKIPEKPEDAFRLAVLGEPTKIRLGEVNKEIFLINASLGLYAKAIHERDSRRKVFGRHRIVVIMSTIISLLSRHRSMHVDLVIDGEARKFKTPMIFVGNNALQLRNLKMDVARCMKRDLLAVVMMKPVSRFHILRTLFRGLLKTIENEERLETFCVESLDIHTRKNVVTVALDGEIFQMNAPLKIRSRPEILNMIRP